MHRHVCVKRRPLDCGPPCRGRKTARHQRCWCEMAARNSFGGLGVSEIPLKVPLRGTDFGRAMQQLMQGEANATNILAAANELQQRRDRLAGIETLSEMTVDEALELMLAYDRQLEDLQGRLEVRLPECPTHTHLSLVRDVPCDAPLHSCRAAGRSSARSSGGAPRGSTRRIASRKTSTSSVRASASTSPPGSATSAHARGKGGPRLAG